MTTSVSAGHFNQATLKKEFLNKAVSTKFSLRTDVELVHVLSLVASYKGHTHTLTCILHLTT